MREAELLIGKIILEFVKNLENDEVYINFLREENERLKNDIVQLRDDIERLKFEVIERSAKDGESTR